MRFPIGMRLHARGGIDRFDHNDPWPISAQIEGVDDIGLGSLAIHLQEMHVSRRMLLENPVECPNLDFNLIVREPVPFLLRRDRGIESRHSGAVNHGESSAAIFLARGHTEVDVAWPGRLEHCVVSRHRLDIDAAPTLFVEMSCHGLDVRVPRADIDIKSLPYIAERARQDYVLEILRVRDHDLSHLPNHCGVLPGRRSSPHRSAVASPTQRSRAHP